MKEEEKFIPMTKSQTRIFLDVAVDPAGALEKLRESNPNLAEDIARCQTQAAEDNRKANAGRFRSAASLSIRES
jgi:hypothetical protein